jgi:3-dehydroquinate dehydratase II
MSLIFILNGPNLNLLGEREPHIYGHTTLEQIKTTCQKTGHEHGLEVDFRQSNHEGVLIDWIQEARGKAVGLILNPAGYTTTSMAIPEALKTFAGPTIELHLSNIHKREDFRHKSLVSANVNGIVTGFGADGYWLAIQAISRLISTKSQSRCLTVSEDAQ